MTRTVRAIRAFAHFWWEFLVGDAPELTVAAAMVVGLSFALAHDHALGIVLLPVVTAAFLFFSATRGRRRAPAERRPGRPTDGD